MAYEPFGGLGTKSSSLDTSFFDFKPPKRKKRKNELTARQLALILAARERETGRSFGDRLKGVGKGALGGATWTLDKIMRPSYGAVNTISEVLRGEDNKLHLERMPRAFWEGFSGQEKKGMGEVLSEHNILNNHKIARGVVGLAGDIVTDPLMALSVAAAPVTGGTSVAGYMALKAAGRSVTPKILNAAAREAGQRALKGEIDDELVEILEAAGPKYAHRLALVKHNKTLDEFQGPAQISKRTERHLLENMGAAESRLYDPLRAQVKIGTRKHSVTVAKLPVIARPGAKLAMKELPILSQLADTAGRAFVPGFKNDVVHAGTLARKHAAEFNAMRASEDVQRIMQGMDSSLDEDAMLEALHLFELPIKTQRGGRWTSMKPDKLRPGNFVLNERYIAHLKKIGRLDDIQEDFVRRYQNATEHLYNLDKLAGVDVTHFAARTGRMYVPHITKSGEDLVPTVTQKGYTTKAGFQHGRDSSMSVAQMKRLVAEGKLPKDIETNPLEILARRSRAGAEKQGDMALINTLKAAVGVPTRLVDKKKVARAEARREAAEAKLAGAIRASAHAEDEYHKAIAKVKHELLDVQNKTLNVLNKAIKSEKDKAKKKKLEALEKKLNKALDNVNATKEVQRQLRAVKHGTVSTPRTVKMMAEAKKLQNLVEDALRQLDNPKTQAHQRAVANELDGFKAARSAVLDAKRELRAADKFIKQAKRGKKNPKAHSNLVESKAITDEFGNTYMFPEEASQAFLRLERLVSGEDKTVSNFAKSAAHWMGAWKILVTTVNPGYRIRNTMTDFWNMWIAGVPGTAMAVYGKRSARLLRDLKTGDPQAFRTIQEAADHGILSGLFAGDIQQVAQMLKYSGSKRQLLRNKRYIRLYTKVAQDINRNAENWGRLTHYLYRRQNLGESASEAAFRVKIAHFDYEDLTPFEQKVMKNIFPFYTWTRKNIPYQVKQIFARPGRYAAFPKLAQEAEFAADPENQQAVPGYVQDNFGFNIPFGKDSFYMPQFGVSDLAVFQGRGEATQRLKGMLGPQIKIPAEIALNKSFFTGQDIAPEDRPRVPVSGLGAKLMSLLPGSNVGTTKRGEISGPGANPWYAYAASQIPMGRMALVTGGGIRAKQNDHAALLSYFGGQSVVNVDPDQQAEFDRYSLEADVDKMLQGLRDEGLNIGRKRKKSKIDKLIEQMLKGDYDG